MLPKPFLGDHVFSVRPFRRYLFRCRTFSAHIVSAPIRCSLTVHLFRVWVSVSKKHRILAPKSRGPFSWLSFSSSFFDNHFSKSFRSTFFNNSLNTWINPWKPSEHLRLFGVFEQIDTELLVFKRNIELNNELNIE